MTTSTKENGSDSVPTYLKNYAEIYHSSPREANLSWFKDAQFGLFMHYGLYSIIGEGEWVQLRHDPPIPVADYDTLRKHFTCEAFDADFITDLALEAGMKYVNITSRHHDGFSLFPTEFSDFDVMSTPCQRDLIGELYQACQEKGLGLFLYYSYAADWSHPYFYPREAGWDAARPDYDEPQPAYKYESEEDFNKYIAFTHHQLTELLTRYPDIAGIWLDPIMGFYKNPDIFPVDSTYALIRSLSPHALISFKQGATGTEDFCAPEHDAGAIKGEGIEVAERAARLNQGKPREVCTTLQPRTWGYNRQYDGQHHGPEEVMNMLARADSAHANLLLNVGPLPSGAFPEEDIQTLKEVGQRLAEL